MLKPAALLAVLCILAACGSEPGEVPETTENAVGQSAPSQPSTALPADQTAPVTSPNSTADGITPADSNTTLPAATPEEAAPPPEP